MLDAAPTHATPSMPRLEVSDLDRALGFYCGLLGLRLRARRPSGAALEGDGGGPRLALSLRPAARRPSGHAALVCADRRALARTLRRVVEAGVPIYAAADHGVSEAVYLRDPDGNGVELHRDRPESEWPRAGAAALNRPLDLREILASG